MHKKAILDIGMEVLFLLQMAYHLIDPVLHERFGQLLLIMLILHNILDRRWYAGLRNGTCTAKRIFHVIINCSLLFSCLGLMLSAIFLSPAILNFFHLREVLLGRKLHMACTVWSFVLMSVHVGAHWNTVVGITKKQMRYSHRWYPTVGKVIGLLISSYGAYSFVKKKLFQRMFLQIEYASFDYNESLFACLGAYIAIQCLLIRITCYINANCFGIRNIPQSRP